MGQTVRKRTLWGRPESPPKTERTTKIGHNTILTVTARIQLTEIPSSEGIFLRENMMNYPPYTARILTFYAIFCIIAMYILFRDIIGDTEKKLVTEG